MNTLNELAETKKVHNEKKGIIIRILALVYVVLIYASVIGAVGLINYDNTVSGGTVFGILAIPLVILVCSIIYIIKNIQAIDRIAMFDSVIIMKYCLIPFFIFGGFFVCIMAILSFIPVPFMIFVGPVTAVLLCAAGWIYMISGLGFSLPYFIKSYKEKANGLVITMIGIICQLIFAVDVIVSMILTFKEKRLMKLTIGLFIAVMFVMTAGIVWIIVQLI